MYAGLSCLVCISDRREDNTWTLLNQQHFTNDTNDTALLWNPHCYTTVCVRKARGISDEIPGGAAQAFTTMSDSFVSSNFVCSKFIVSHMNWEENNTSLDRLYYGWESIIWLQSLDKRSLGQIIEWSTSSLEAVSMLTHLVTHSLCLHSH